MGGATQGRRRRWQLPAGHSRPAVTKRPHRRLLFRSWGVLGTIPGGNTRCRLSEPRLRRRHAQANSPAAFPQPAFRGHLFWFEVELLRTRVPGVSMRPSHFPRNRFCNRNARTRAVLISDDATVIDYIIFEQPLQRESTLISRPQPPLKPVS